MEQFITLAVYGLMAFVPSLPTFSSGMMDAKVMHEGKEKGVRVYYSWMNRKAMA